MYTCASCTLLACCKPGTPDRPKNCPMHNAELNAEIFDKYGDPENRTLSQQSAAVEGAGYGRWPRMREIMELARRMGYTRLGMAFCAGLRKEAKIIEGILRDNGFEVVSIICKTGGHSKETVGIAEEDKLSPGKFEAMCNPIAQAELLNEQQTHFNFTVGLCVGHDSLFYKYSNALVTTLIAKDRVAAHNPAGPIYCAGSYFRNVFKPETRTSR
ncbi:MAG: DUF1847 domain-containing protein [Ruminococcaceae bacterium]|nr:DUF1847 domain-containing protein [Oscillospiraceae bacterium]